MALVGQEALRPARLALMKISEVCARLGRLSYTGISGEPKLFLCPPLVIFHVPRDVTVGPQPGEQLIILLSVEEAPRLCRIPNAYKAGYCYAADPSRMR